MEIRSCCHLLLLLVSVCCLVRGEVMCSSNNRNASQNDCRVSSEPCSDVEPQTCLPVTFDSSIPDDLYNHPKGCGGERQHCLPFGPRTQTNSNVSLNFSMVAHNTMYYNLTVSWEYLNQTVPAGAQYQLKVFRNRKTSFYRCICSQQVSDGPPLWTTDSFDLLPITTPLSLVEVEVEVELSILYENGTELLVVSTSLLSPHGCLDILPVSPYRCITKDYRLRKKSVSNITHSLSDYNGTYKLTLSWLPHVDITRYMIPMMYFITINSSYSSTTFTTRQTSLSIWPLQPTREYSLRVEPFMPCSDRCGDSALQTILSTPTSSPNITMASSLSHSEILVTWTEIPQALSNGNISLYDVKFEADNVSSTINTTNHSVILSNLIASTNYSISVRGYTSVGPGPYSQQLIVTTGDAPVSTSPFSSPLVLSIVLPVVSLLVLVVISLLVILILTKCYLKLVYQKRTLSPSATNIELPAIDLEPDGYSSDNSTVICVGDTKEEDCVSTCTETTPAAACCNMPCGASCSVSPAVSPSQTLEPIIVLSQSTPDDLKDEILPWLLMELQRPRSSNNTKIIPKLPETESSRQTASEFLHTRINVIKDNGQEELCFLCVVNSAFGKDWNCRETTTANNQCLVYPLSRYVLGMENYRIKPTDHILVLYWEEIDLHHVPPILRQCSKACVNDTEKIAKFVFEQPQCSLGEAF